ncbi:hypothetical protein O9993_08320 [Vibrio lentus]|nr:hypothetical protein [Vibrio lentus]
MSWFALQMVQCIICNGAYLAVRGMCTQKHLGHPRPGAAVRQTLMPSVARRLVTRRELRMLDHPQAQNHATNAVQSTVLNARLLKTQMKFVFPFAERDQAMPNRFLE